MSLLFSRNSIIKAIIYTSFSRNSIIKARMGTLKFHVVMFPWFAIGHITPFLDLSNKFAERGHRVTFLIPSKTQSKFDHLNLYPHLINFIPLTVPQLDNLPLGAETMSDVPIHQFPLLAKAFDLTQDQVKTILHNLHPNLIFFDFSHWIPSFARTLGAKCICFLVVSAIACAFSLVPSKAHDKTLDQMMKPPEGYPNDVIKLVHFEAKRRVLFTTEIDGGISQFDRLTTSMRESDALCFRACGEMEGPFCDYLQNIYNKQLLLTGPNLPKPSTIPLEQTWERWLSDFKKGSVVYIAFGSEFVFNKDQFQELVLGLELTGLPFLARLKPPFGVETVEEGLPEGFEERVRGRGVVHGGWVQMQQILNHPSVGCFMHHCGSGSTWESLASICQIVLLPQSSDQFLNARFMSRELKVAVEVERREEDGWFTKESVCKAVKLVMDQGSEVGEQVKANHNKWREFLLTQGLEESYINNFMVQLQTVL